MSAFLASAASKVVSEGTWGTEGEGGGEADASEPADEDEEEKVSTQLVGLFATDAVQALKEVKYSAE